MMSLSDLILAMTALGSAALTLNPRMDRHWALAAGAAVALLGVGLALFVAGRTA